MEYGVLKKYTEFTECNECFAGVIGGIGLFYIGRDGELMFVVVNIL